MKSTKDSNVEKVRYNSACEFIEKVVCKPNIGLVPAACAGTPNRLVRMWDELTAGYRLSPKEILSSKFANEESYDQMVVSANIDFVSICEHHLLPFFGKAHVGYLVKDELVGLSKLARVVDCFARRLQMQERMTKQIADTIQQELKPLGVGVMIEATHLCMVVRGVRKSEPVMLTSTLLGNFQESHVKEEFFRLCGK